MKYCGTIGKGSVHEILWKKVHEALCNKTKWFFKLRIHTYGQDFLANLYLGWCVARLQTQCRTEIRRQSLWTNSPVRWQGTLVWYLY